MLLFRWLASLLLLASAVSMVLYLATGKVQYRRWAFIIFKWTVVAGLAFFAVLFFSHLV
ncbi:hypothetical protein [Comamonas composti]|uniref:hypothetical protein n=1 Tax=Comamonas composti TaxID=408558 RepID=UPI0003FE8F8E|nr:hypothetical protein [Comamonas composti]